MTYEEFSNHDCTLSSEDSCAGCEQWYKNGRFYICDKCWCHTDLEETEGERLHWNDCEYFKCPDCEGTGYIMVNEYINGELVGIGTEQAPCKHISYERTTN